MFKNTLSLAIALGIAAAASPLAAQDDTQIEVRVSIADLDLTTKAGQATLDRRLNSAARKVCGGKPSVRDLTVVLAYRACRKETREQYWGARMVAVNRALEAANAKRVAVLADKLGFIAVR